jgi:hypothetical protein
MAKSLISIGSTSNDGTGDTLRSGAQKINANFDEIYSVFGDGTTLSSSVSQAISASYASSAGIATVSQNLVGAPNLTVGILTASSSNLYGTTSVTNLSVSGSSTFTGTANNINQTAGTAAINRLVVSGVTTSGVGNTSTLGVNSTMQFFLQNNTTLRVAVRGSDGVTRYGTVSLT